VKHHYAKAGGEHGDPVEVMVGGGKERMATTSHEVTEGWKKHTLFG